MLVPVGTPQVLVVGISVGVLVPLGVMHHGRYFGVGVGTRRCSYSPGRRCCSSADTRRYSDSADRRIPRVLIVGFPVMALISFGAMHYGGVIYLY